MRGRQASLLGGPGEAASSQPFCPELPESKLAPPATAGERGCGDAAAGAGLEGSVGPGWAGLLRGDSEPAPPGGRGSRGRSARCSRAAGPLSSETTTSPVSGPRPAPRPSSLTAPQPPASLNIHVQGAHGAQPPRQRGSASCFSEGTPPQKHHVFGVQGQGAGPYGLSGPSSNRWGNNGNNDRLYFWGAQKSLQTVTAAMKLKDVC